MSSLKTLKREVEMLSRALNCKETGDSEQTEKLLFYTDKLIMLSRDPDSEALQALNLEIATFNASHPASPDDLIKIQPYLNVAKLAADTF